jgi:hypothetical protein
VLKVKFDQEILRHQAFQGLNPDKELCVKPGTIAAPDHPAPASCYSPPPYKYRTVVPYLDSLGIA